MNFSSEKCENKKPKKGTYLSSMIFVKNKTFTDELSINNLHYMCRDAEYILGLKYFKGIQ